MSEKDSKSYLSYAEAGVDEPREQEALNKMLYWFKKTYSFRSGIGSTFYSIGHFANILEMGAGLGLVLTTDGVGTKLIIAQMLDKYDTVGIDCIANNVNDILCLGAEPVALLDYIAINTVNEQVLEDIAKGLCMGAEEAHICIPGGEIAQVADMLACTNGATSVDLVGSAIGVVGLSPQRTDLPPLVDGKKITPGDIVIGLLSSGLHSNGYSLARKVLLDQAKLRLDQYVDELGKTLGEELLTPTSIYVDPVLSLLRKGLSVHGMVNVSGGGLLSLGRLPADYSYVIKNILSPPPVFKLIQKYGSIPDTVMFAAFNMGIGFCLICAETDAERVIEEVHSKGHKAMRLGKVLDKPGRRIFLEPYRLVGFGEAFIEG
jgi:phosphoribosylformylglycinamidine cyclo-ligase